MANTLDGKCRKKKRGHVCILDEGHKDELHQCFCSTNEKWEEVKT